MSFSTSELRKLLHLPNIDFDIYEKKDILNQIESSRPTWSSVRPKKRQCETFLKLFEKNNTLGEGKTLRFIFNQKVHNLSGGSHVEGLVLGATNSLQESISDLQFQPYDLVIFSIGYDVASLVSDQLSKFENGAIRHINGRVEGEIHTYVCGWASTGAVGTIATVSKSVDDVVSCLLSDFSSLKTSSLPLTSIGKLNILQYTTTF